MGATSEAGKSELIMCSIGVRSILLLIASCS